MRYFQSTTSRAMIVGALLIVVLVSIGVLSGIVQWQPAPIPATDAGIETPVVKEPKPGGDAPEDPKPPPVEPGGALIEDGN